MVTCVYTLFTRDVYVVGHPPRPVFTRVYSSASPVFAHFYLWFSHVSLLLLFLLCRFAPVSGEYLLSASYDTTIKAWSARDFSPIATFRGHEGKVRSYVVSSTWLTFALLNSTHCHSFRGQENTRARACANYARACQPHDDDLTLYICSYILSQLTQITGLCIMPDERHFVSASFDRMIKLWGTD